MSFKLLDHNTYISKDVSTGKTYQIYALTNLIALFLISTLILYGWLYGKSNLTQPLPGYHPMSPITSLAFIFSAIGIKCLIALGNVHKLVLLRTVLSGLIFLIGLTGLLIYFRIIEPVMPQFLLAEVLSVHRFNNQQLLMAPNTGFSFVLGSIAILFMNRRSVLPVYISLLTGLISLLTIIGYIHKVPEFYAGVQTPMSIYTAVCFLLLSSSILFLERENGFMAIITSNQYDGRIARQMLPISLIVPVFIDVLRLYGENLGLYDHAFGIALCSLVITIIFTYGLWKVLKFISRINHSLESEILVREKAEVGLKLANSFLDKILDNIPDMVFVKQGKDLSYVNVNKAGEQIMGMKEEFMIGKNDYDLFPAHVADVFREKDLEVINSGGIALTEEEPITTGEEVRWLRTKKIVVTDENSEPRFLIGISEDITEKRSQAQMLKRFYQELEQKVKERTEELSKSENRFRALLENGTDFISMIDSSLKIIYQSPAVERMTGFSVEDRMNEPVLRYAHPEDLKKLTSHYIDSISNPRIALPIQYRMLTKPGNYIWVEGTVINLIDDESVKAIVANYRNVSERKKYEDEREKLIIELVQNNNELRQFSYIISHNLRAPVANLLGLLSLVDDYPIESTGLKNILMDIEKSSTFLNSTITDLVKVVKIKNSTSVRLEKIELYEVFSKVINQASILIKQEQAEIDFEFDCAPRVYFNRSYLESILQNLLSNALKYKSPDRELVLRVHSEKKDRYVYLIFTDNGLGIDTERYKDRLYGLYQRFHSGFEGKGLGLYLVKSQMKALNGDIEIESEVGKGTTVILKFNIPDHS